MNKMIAIVTRALKFLRITDETNNLSITNIFVIALGLNLMVQPEASFIAVSGFIMALLQYGHKRYVYTTDQRLVNVDSTFQQIIIDHDKKLAQQLEVGKQITDDYEKIFAVKREEFMTKNQIELDVLKQRLQAVEQATNRKHLMQGPMNRGLI